MYVPMRMGRIFYPSYPSSQRRLLQIPEWSLGSESRQGRCADSRIAPQTRETCWRSYRTARSGTFTRSGFTPPDEGDAPTVRSHRQKREAHPRSDRTARRGTPDCSVFTPPDERDALAVRSHRQLEKGICHRIKPPNDQMKETVERCRRYNTIMKKDSGRGVTKPRGDTCLRLLRYDLAAKKEKGVGGGMQPQVRVVEQPNHHRDSSLPSTLEVLLASSRYAFCVKNKHFMADNSTHCSARTGQLLLSVSIATQFTAKCSKADGAPRTSKFPAFSYNGKSLRTQWNRRRDGWNCY
ncbi:hypothetical protein B0H19DRAFT_1078219 [Mycena capillaripes]|nr:hypothetical protein B0H19DRAFT_1078219 [Mycena capillaripes]